jgi:hypothetical protein
MDVEILIEYRLDRGLYSFCSNVLKTQHMYCKQETIMMCFPLPS